MTKGGVALLIVPLIGGCLWTTPEQAAEDALPYDGREGMDHMAGYPCAVCHSDFVLAGTVYERAGDSYGLGGAEVEITDEQGRSFTATTNWAGTFVVGGGDGGEDEDEDEGRGDDGRVKAPFRLDWPLEVVVRGSGRERRMRSRIHREASCASCHALAGESAGSAGRIVLLDDGE